MPDRDPSVAEGDDCPTCGMDGSAIGDLRDALATERAVREEVAEKLRVIARERAGEYDADTMWLAVDPSELRALADELTASAEPVEEGTND